MRVRAISSSRIASTGDAVVENRDWAESEPDRAAAARRPSDCVGSEWTWSTGGVTVRVAWSPTGSPVSSGAGRSSVCSSNGASCAGTTPSSTRARGPRSTVGLSSSPRGLATTATLL
jgi:hypothetical protein